MTQVLQSATTPAADDNAQERYSVAEEKANAISHGVGLILAFVATIFLVAAAAQSPSPWALAAVGVYSLTLTFVFAASTLYHGAFGSRFQNFYRLLDHIAIYLKIAGSYTPFALVVLPAETGIPLLGFVWAIAAVGIAFKISAHAFRIKDRFRIVSLGLYLMMGWSGVVIVGDLYDLLPFSGFIWLVAGGLAYTVGAIFYAVKSIPMGHFIWHLFVLAGSACHVVTVYAFVL